MMGLYYFSESTDASGLSPDDEGLEFGTFGDACEAAEIALREIAAHAPPKVNSFSLTVFDADLKPVHRRQLETRSVAPVLNSQLMDASSKARENVKSS